MARDPGGLPGNTGYIRSREIRRTRGPLLTERGTAALGWALLLAGLALAAWIRWS